MNRVTLSIIIINFNSKKLLVDCLNSIFTSYPDIFFEIIVVDNNSNENIKDLEIIYTKVKFIYNKLNLGFGAANNIGIKESTGEFVLLLNPDTIVNGNSFIPMMDYLENNADVGVVGCKIYNEKGEIERSTHSFPTLVKEFFHSNEFLKIFFGYNNRLIKIFFDLFKFNSLHSYNDHDNKMEVDHVTGACMMLKREVITNVGLFDEAFFLYNEEVEWSLRIKKAGYKIIFLPNSYIIHLFGCSTGQRVQKQKVNKLLVERYRGMFYFFQKHYSKVKLTMLRIIVFQGFMLRFLTYFTMNLFVIFIKERRNKIKYYLSILNLCFKNNFDWRIE